MVQILCGIAFNHHDSSISFSLEDKVVLVLEAERIFRQKKKQCTAKEMEELILKGLEIINRTIDDVSYWAMGTLNNPWLKDSDILDLEEIPREPYWKKINFLNKDRKCLIINHHLAHASSYYFSPFEDALVLTCDGRGDGGENVSVYKGNHNRLERMDIPLSKFISAKPYDIASRYLYGARMCEGKFMALSSFGLPHELYSQLFEEAIPLLCKARFDESGQEIMRKLFPNLERRTVANLETDVLEFSATVQSSFLRHRLEEVSTLLKHSSERNIILVGGAGLNLEVNSKVLETFPEINVFVPPCCDDTGQSLGALSYLIVEVYGYRPVIKLPYLGFGSEIFNYTEEDLDLLVESILRDGVILIHNGKSEIGPRALGNRSFIARADSVKMKSVLSEKIKKRETYRPLAPIVLEEKVNDYFEGPLSSPFMLFNYKLKDERLRKNLIGALHCDDTSRAQTIRRENNPFIYDLLKKYGDRTGIYLLLNTSLNLKGEPISNSIGDTIEISGKIDYNHQVVYNGKIIRI